MKKNLLVSLAVLGAASMLCGFDSAETLDSLSAKMNEASQSVNGATAAMGMNVDAALNISDGTTNSSINFVVKGDINYDISMVPFAMKMDGGMTVSAMGENQNINLQTYAVADENGALKTYTYAEDGTGEAGEWAVAVADDMNINEIMESSREMSMSFSDMAEWGLAFELAPEAADVDGTECYLLSTTINADSLNTLIQKASEMTGQDLASDDLSSVLSMLGGLQMKIEYYVDSATYLPVKIHMDMNDSDFSALSTLLNAYMGTPASEDAPASTVDLVVNDISLDMNSSYGDAPEITVPQEALDAEAAGNVESVDDLADSVMEEAM